MQLSAPQCRKKFIFYLLMEKEADNLELLFIYHSILSNDNFLHSSDIQIYLTFPRFSFYCIVKLKSLGPHHLNKSSCG